MASPLRLFRKYQYLFLVALGIMLMFAFVVAPPLMDYLQGRAGAGPGANPVVVTWKSGEIREIDMNRMRTQHFLTTRFLQTLARRVEITEAVPVEWKGQQVDLIKGRSYPFAGSATGPDNLPVYQIVVQGEIVDVPQSAVRGVMPRVEMIAQAANEEELLQRLLLAEKAREMGVVINEGAVFDYLDALCDASPTNRLNYARLLSEATNGRLDMQQFCAQMVIELAAQRMLIMSQSGLYAVAPAELYAGYNKLNRRVTAELLAVDVAEFLSQVPDSSDQELAALYDQGKNRFPSPLSSEPGFKRRTEIAFGYFKGVFDDFLAREMAVIRPTITDEEVTKYYEDNKDTEYKVPVLPAAEPEKTTPEAEEPATPAAKEGTTPETGPPADAAKTEAKQDTAPPDTMPAKEPPAGASPPEGTEPPKTEPAKTEPPKTEPPKTEPPAAEPPKSEPAKSGDPASEPPKSPATGEPSPPATPAKLEGPVLPPGTEDSSGGGQSARGDQSPLIAGQVSFVGFQQADPPQNKEETPAKEQVEPKTDPAATTTSDVSEQGKVEPKKTDVATATEAEAKAAGETKIAPDGAMAPGTESPQADATKPAAPPVQYKPLDDKLRDEIRDTLSRRKAREPAQEKLEQAIDVARNTVERFARQLSRSQFLEDVERPEPLDMEAIARENNLVYQKTPLLDQADIAEIQRLDPADGEPAYYEFARATETLFGQQTGMIRRTIIDVGFEREVELYLPRRLVDGILPEGSFPIPPEKLYLYWRTEVVPEAVPPLEEIREEVARASKMQKALPLAEKKAADMARQAAEAAKPLAEVFADNAKKVIRTTEFSWMTRGALPGSTGSRPILSPVNGFADGQPVSVSGAGNDFMKAVFALAVGQVGTAVNQPQTFVYLVRLEKDDPPDEQRREAFFAAGYTPDVNALVQTEQAAIIRDWFDDIVKQYEVDWKRDPITAWSSE